MFDIMEMVDDLSDFFCCPVCIDVEHGNFQLTKMKQFVWLSKYDNARQAINLALTLQNEGLAMYVAESPFNSIEKKKKIIAGRSEFAVRRELARQKDDFNFQMHKALHQANWEYEHDSDD